MLHTSPWKNKRLAADAIAVEAVIKMFDVSTTDQGLEIQIAAL